MLSVWIMKPYDKSKLAAEKVESRRESLLSGSEANTEIASVSKFKYGPLAGKSF